MGSYNEYSKTYKVCVAFISDGSGEDERPGINCDTAKIGSLAEERFPEHQLIKVWFTDWTNQSFDPLTYMDLRTEGLTTKNEKAKKLISDMDKWIRDNLDIVSGDGKLSAAKAGSCSVFFRSCEVDKAVFDSFMKTYSSR